MAHELNGFESEIWSANEMVWHLVSVIHPALGLWIGHHTHLEIAQGEARSYHRHSH